MTDYALSQLSVQTTLADGDLVPFLDVSDHSTAPAGPAGADKVIPAASAAVAFYRGAKLVLPVSGNTASGNAAAIQAADDGSSNIVKLAPVAWNIACGTITHNGSGFSWDARGATITASGTGDLFRQYDSSNYESRAVHGGGLTGWPFIDGTATTGASCAFHGGDIFNLKTQAFAQNFTGTGARAFLWDNQWAISEQMDVDVWASNCTTHFEWTQTPAVGNTFCFGSFERSRMRLRFSQVNASSLVFKFSAGVYFDGYTAEVKGNATGTNGGAITTAMFYATGTSPSGSQDGTGVVSSNFANGPVDCNIELDNNGGTDWTFNPTTFKVDGSCFFGGLTGTLNFGAASRAWTPTSAIVGFYGETDGGDPSIVSNTVQAQLFQGLTAIGTYAAGAALASNGTISTAASWAIVAPTGAVTGVILGAGAWDGQVVKVVNASAFPVTFAAAGTSNVSDGAADSVPPNSLRVYSWSVDAAQWIPESGSSRQRVTLTTAFTQASGTSAQNVTGMSAVLAAGTYKVTAWAPFKQTAGTTATETLKWSFSGTASAVMAKWLLTTGTTQSTAVVTAITTAGPVSPTLTSAVVMLGEFSGLVVVSAAGTLQLQVTASATSNTVQFPVGCFIDVEPLA